MLRIRHTVTFSIAKMEKKVEIKSKDSVLKKLTCSSGFAATDMPGAASAQSELAWSRRQRRPRPGFLASAQPGAEGKPAQPGMDEWLAQPDRGKCRPSRVLKEGGPAGILPRASPVVECRDPPRAGPRRN
jgi:hypothetical protein